MFLSNKKNMLYKASKHAEKVAKSLRSQLFSYYCILYFKHDDFNGKNVGFNVETLRFKREQTCEIVRASCLNVMAVFYMNLFASRTQSC